MKTNTCKICRRIGEKLFLKGDKCSSPKCPLLRKPYPPGASPKKQKSTVLSEYGRELRETQKLKKMYFISEKQFKNLVKECLKKRGKEDVSQLLIKKLEKKLYNVVYRAGYARSRRGAKQLVSHGHFLLNKKKVTIPSIEVKVGDEIRIRESSQKKPYFVKTLPMIEKEKNIPSWISFDKDKTSLKIVSEPDVESLGIKADIPLIISFYSH